MQAGPTAVFRVHEFKHMPGSADIPRQAGFDTAASADSLATREHAWGRLYTCSFGQTLASKHSLGQLAVGLNRDGIFFL